MFDDADVKRSVKRFEYMTNDVTGVELVTPGHDGCTLAFTIGDRLMVMEYSKSDTELAKANYKLLISLSQQQQKNSLARDMAMNMLKQINLSSADATEKFFEKLPTLSRGFLTSLQPESYEELFKK